MPTSRIVLVRWQAEIDYHMDFVQINVFFLKLDTQLQETTRAKKTFVSYVF